MSELLRSIIVVGFGALCFGVGYLTASFVTRNRWRDEIIKRGFARYNWYTGKWEWGTTERMSYLAPARRFPPPLSSSR